ncbi:hypothetical protein H4R24_000295 [Coemansia sp. RSA 988]|nr:hypothetical protein H4R24_000295 [Coemansia sp. RSA 988]
MTQPPLTIGAATAANAAENCEEPQQEQQQLARENALTEDSTPKRVHFSSRNEILCDSSPQSSPTRARARPRSRGILKHGSSDGQRQRGSSDAEQLGENGLLDRLSPSPNTTEDLQLTAEVAAAAVERLQQAPPGSEAETETEEAYNQMSKLIARHRGSLDGYAMQIEALLQCVSRDIGDREAGRQVVLAATRCLGSALHSMVMGSIMSELVARALAVVARRVLQEFVTDRAVLQAALWTVGSVRVLSAADAQAQAPRMVRLCMAALTQFEGSATMQFESLIALEGLLRRAPAATRQMFREWLFPVLGCVVSVIPGVRTKADAILRHNMPWVTADAHDSEMDALVQEFLATRLDHVLAGAMRMLDRDEHILAARVWGMVVAICARHCRPRLNNILRLAQECFNSTEEDVLVVMLTQWRCLIYAFALDNRIHHHKCVQLVMTPIVTLMAAPDTSVTVQEACVGCWATLVYALGPEIGSHIDIISRIPALVRDSPHSVQIAVARILGALFNCFVLAEDRVAQFVIPRMIIGTTTLAAADGHSLSSTNGPFSTDTANIGDHTSILCTYVIGLSATSPTVPVIAEIAVRFIERYISVYQLCTRDACCKYAASLQHGAFASLCDALAAAMAASASESGGKCTRLAIALAEACHDAQHFKTRIEINVCAVCVERFADSPCAFLFTALHCRLARRLTEAYVDIPWLVEDFLKSNSRDPPFVAAGGQQSITRETKTPLLYVLEWDHAKRALLRLSANSDKVLNTDYESTFSSLSHYFSSILPDTPWPGEPSDVLCDKVFATVSLLSYFLMDLRYCGAAGIIRSYHVLPGMELLLIQTLGRAAAQLPVKFGAAEASMLVWNVLLMDHLLPADLHDAQCQFISKAGDMLRGDYFWRTAAEIVVGLKQQDKLFLDRGDLRLLRELCMSCGATTVGSAEAMGCSVLSVVMLSEIIHTATDRRWSPLDSFLEHLLEYARVSDSQAVEKLNVDITRHLHAMTVFVAAKSHPIRLELVPGLRYVAVAMILAVHGDLRGFAYEIDRSANSLELDIPFCSESLSGSKRSVVLQVERLLCALKLPMPDNVDDAPAAVAISSSDDTTALPVPVDRSPVQQDSMVEPVPTPDLQDLVSDRESIPSKRTRSHTPSEEEGSDRTKECGGAEYWSQPSMESTASPRPQRRKRRKRTQRRAMKNRLDTLLDGLEAELRDPLQGHGLGQLLQVQCRIAAIQRILCNATLLLADPMETTSTDTSTRHE